MLEFIWLIKISKFSKMYLKLKLRVDIKANGGAPDDKIS